MKMLEKLQKRLHEGKKDNKGFSLVELIIVIAIMAILIGIVGTQVIPYLNRSREAKDLQIINSYCTAAVTSYSSHAEAWADLEKAGADISITMYGTAPTGEPQKTWYSDILELTGYDALADMTGAMTSTKGKDIDGVVITISWTDKTITAQAMDGTDEVFEEVVSHI